MKQETVGLLGIFIGDKKAKLVGAGITGLLLLLSVIGLITLANSGTLAVASIADAPHDFSMWQEQLPESHWLNEPLNWSTKQLIFAKLALGRGGIITFDFSLDGYKSQMDTVNSFIADIIEKQHEKDLPKATLTNDENETVKRVVVRTGEVQTYLFKIGETALPFDVTEKDFQHGQFPVLSYIEDTGIATIYNGTITGNRKGKTELVICYGGAKFTYQVTVK